MIELRNNVVFLNGKRLDYEIVKGHPFGKEIFEDSAAVVAKEQSADGAHWVMGLPTRMARRDYPLTSIPAGKYFMMGDSRDNSFDSRYYGLVDQKQIVGNVKRVILSFDKNHRYVPRFKRSFSAL